jgi:uncharacterized protein YndB with AHSA1/START domain
MAAANRIAETSFTTPSDREIVITREFNAPRRLVFEAWTSCEHLPHWMLGPPGWTMSICEMDLKLGGKRRLGWRGQDGATMEIRGVTKECVPPERLVCTESWGDPWPETLDTLLFTEREGITTVTLTVLYPSKEARDAALQSGMKEGMNAGYERLDSLLRKLTT